MYRKPIVRLNFYLLLAALLTACGAGERSASGIWSGTVDTLENGAIHTRNPATGIWDEASAWRLEEELRIGSADLEGPSLFGYISDITVDDYGRIYVMENQAQEIRVFNPDGSHLRTIGRRGSGPGEFEGAVGLRWGPEGNLWVIDQNNARYSVFDTTGTYLTMNRRASGYSSMPWHGTIGPDGHLIDIASGPNAPDGFSTMVLVSHHFEDQSPVPVDTIWIPEVEGAYFEHLTEGGGTRVTIPFTPQVSWYLGPRGFFWHGVTDSYQIVQENLAGDTVRIIEREFSPTRVSREERRAAIERLDWFIEEGGRIDASRIPSTRPAFRNFFTDSDGYLWVSPSAPVTEEGRKFDIFDPEGYFLGTATADFAADNNLRVVDRDRFYSVVRDELDIPYVIRARIVGRSENERELRQ